MAGYRSALSFSPVITGLNNPTTEKLIPTLRLVKCRFGSEADLCIAKRHVRSTPGRDHECGHPTRSFPLCPQKRHVRCNYGCPLWANSGHADRYSITSSASSCIEFGTLSPSTFAVPIFMTSSYFLGNSNGKSPGFSPLTILAA